MSRITRAELPVSGASESEVPVSGVSESELPVFGVSESELPAIEVSESELLPFWVLRSFRVTGIGSPLYVNFMLRSAVRRSSDRSVVMT